MTFQDQFHVVDRVGLRKVVLVVLVDDGSWLRKINASRLTATIAPITTEQRIIIAIREGNTRFFTNLAKVLDWVDGETTLISILGDTGDYA